MDLLAVYWVFTSKPCPQLCFHIKYLPGKIIYPQLLNQTLWGQMYFRTHNSLDVAP